MARRKLRVRIPGASIAPVLCGRSSCPTGSGFDSLRESAGSDNGQSRRLITSRSRFDSWSRNGGQSSGVDVPLTSVRASVQIRPRQSGCVAQWQSVLLITRQSEVRLLSRPSWTHGPVVRYGPHETVTEVRLLVCPLGSGGWRSPLPPRAPNSTGRAPPERCSDEPSFGSLTLTRMPSWQDGSSGFESRGCPYAARQWSNLVRTPAFQAGSPGSNPG